MGFIRPELNLRNYEKLISYNNLRLKGLYF